VSSSAGATPRVPCRSCLIASLHLRYSCQHPKQEVLQRKIAMDSHAGRRSASNRSMSRDGRSSSEQWSQSVLTYLSASGQNRRFAHAEGSCGGRTELAPPAKAALCIARPQWIDSA
jgi:hypothetical protein